MSTIKLAIGEDSQATVKDAFGSKIRIGVNGSGAVIFTMDADGENQADDYTELRQNVSIALTGEQTRDLAKELLRLNPET